MVKHFYRYVICIYYNTYSYTSINIYMKVLWNAATVYSAIYIIYLLCLHVVVGSVCIWTFYSTL